MTEVETDSRWSQTIPLSGRTTSPKVPTVTAQLSGTTAGSLLSPTVHVSVHTLH